MLKKTKGWNCGVQQNKQLKAGNCSTQARLSAVPFRAVRQRSTEHWDPEHRVEGLRQWDRGKDGDKTTRSKGTLITVITTEVLFQNS